MDKLNLCGKWTLENTNTGNIFDAEVPGLNLLDLINCGEISEDCKSDEEFSFISETEWKYSKTFFVNKEQLSKKHAYLHFERLDTLCEITLNSQQVAKTSNIHLSYKFDVKPMLKEGENTIVVTFSSIKDYIKKRQKQNELPYNAMGITGHAHIRKVACHFGWDFAGQYGMQGIGGKCFIDFVSESEIENFFVYQKLYSSSAKISVSVALSEPLSETNLEITLTEPCGKVHTKAVQSAQEKTDVSFDVEDPKLWWCNGLGSQPLYKITAVLKHGKAVTEVQEKKIGLRKITLDRSGGNFHFHVNGVPIFAKGANYVPTDLLYTRITRERLYALLSECKKAGMNMVRVWGGGFYESDDFYDICDELGLLVWQDCAFACCAYPFMEEDFLLSVKAEILQNVPRIMHHASLALWCGNNEIESISMAWLHRRSFIVYAEKFFYKILPDLIRMFDSETPYHACSPSSGKYMKLINSDKAGDTHIWNVWHGFQTKDYFQKRTTRFCSEFGMESYPTKGTSAHQKCDLGEERLTYYMTKHFTLPQTYAEKRFLTQLVQLEAMKEATEHFRRNMHQCHGALFWQLNDCWNGVSWSAMDFYMGKKALMYGAKSFNEQVHVSAVKKGKTINIHISNDANSNFEGKLIVCTAPLDEEEKVLLEKTVSVNAVSSKEAASLKVQNSKEHIIVLRLMSLDGKLISENRFALCENKKLKLCDPKLTVETYVKGGRYYASVKAQSYARYVCLESESMAEFSENYFDLSTSQEKHVEIFDPAISDNIKAASLYDVMQHKNKFKDLYENLKAVLKPMSIANRVSRWFDK